MSGQAASVDSGTARRPALAPLTGLRFVAALAVVLLHIVPARFPEARGPLARLIDTGYVGVSLFFVLSGFILAYNYLDPARGALRGSARAFWWARVARVYPLYLFALAFAAPQILGAMVQRPRAPRAVAALALDPLLLQGWWPPAACAWNCPGWSLSVEAFFYLLFPMLGVWLLRRGPRAALRIGAAAWGAGLLLPALYLLTAPDGLVSPTRLDTGRWLVALKFSPVVHLPEFVLGVAAGVHFLAHASPAAGRARDARLARGTALLVTAAVAWFALGPSLPFVLLHTGLLAPVWALVVLALAHGGGLTGRVLGSAPLVRLGEASYALYLIHAPLDVYVRKLLALSSLAPASPWTSLGVFLAAALAYSLVLHRWVETPARRGIARLRTRSVELVPGGSAA